MDAKSIGKLKETGPERQPITNGAHGAQVGGGCEMAPQTQQTTTGVKFGAVGSPIKTSKG